MENRTRKREQTIAIAEKPNPEVTKANGRKRTAVATKPLKIVKTVATGPRR